MRFTIFIFLVSKGCNSCNVYLLGFSVYLAEPRWIGGRPACHFEMELGYKFESLRSRKSENFGQ